jgi:crotonobetainyl-CoA:carnitine CoA-transferase CaiB-like acyl-CoA transferase
LAGALEGVRVLDCTQIIAGPLAGSLLTEMGADVVKVEPLEGEPWRLQAEFFPKESRGYMHVNRGKRAIALNFKHAGAGPIRDKLIRWADVVLTNYRPGVPEQLGIDYESCRALKPDIIFCEGTAFGKEGPDAMRRGYDIVAQAMSGVTTSNPNLNADGLPQQVAFAPSDIVTGVAMAWAITAALYHRERTGEGQAINASLLLTGLFLQAGAKEIVAMDTAPRAERLARLRDARGRGATIGEIYAERRAAMPELAGNIYYRPYQTRDGYLVVGCLGPAPRARFREALQMRDPRYEPGFDQANLKEVGAALVGEAEAKFKTRTTDEWLAVLDAGGVASGPVRFVDELWEDPQVVANAYVESYEHTLLGPLRGNAPLVRMSGTPTRVQRASPALGEHTDEVLAELGFSPDEVSRLRQDDVVG